jgi:hypothetical protein
MIISEKDAAQCRTSSAQHPHGTIEIKGSGIGGRLLIEGLMLVPTSRDFHTGGISARVMPVTASIAFIDDGWVPFETVCDGTCKVRMQRIGPDLLVEDNNGGGGGVSFTGLYHRR